MLLVVGAVVRNQVKVYRARQVAAAEARLRQQLFDELQPVGLLNCQLERFGEAHDGGYLMCGNLLSGVQSAYSYGISGYDKWGCDISTRLNVTLHQYDCFDTTRPACPGGNTIFHEECVDGTTRTEEGRFFDTIENQLARNGDGGKRIVLKIDVEGAEWSSFLSLPDEALDRIDQLAVEFHQVQNQQYVAVVQRLKRFFHVAHRHFNNHSCTAGLEPFPTWAYEVLFVSKRLGAVDPSRTVGGVHPLDAPNDPAAPDCQPAASRIPADRATSPINRAGCSAARPAGRCPRRPRQPLPGRSSRRMTTTRASQ
jgi:hypothetical protein